jgi:branched-chain amino acid transport system permease protein
MFVLMVMYAPWGLAGLLLMHQPLLAAGTLRRVLPAYALVALPSLMLFVGGVLLIETSHHLLVKAAEGPAMRLLGVDYAANAPSVWIVIVLLLSVGAVLLRRLAPGVTDAFHAARQDALTRRSAA